MWEFTKIFSSSDNLFKFLFVGGISMVFVAMFYPLRKQHELELKANQFAMEKSLLLQKINNLESRVSDLNNLDANLGKQLDSLNLLLVKTKRNTRKSEIRAEGKDLIIEFDKKKVSAKKIAEELAIQNIKLEYSGKGIEILKNQSESYKGYTCLLKILGGLIFIIGFIGWCFTTFKTEQLRQQQLDKNQRELDNDNPIDLK